MISILLGPDDFSKQEYISKMALQHKAETVRFGEGDKPRTDELSEQNLFSQPKVFVLPGFLKAVADDPVATERLISSSNHIVFVEPKADKRLSSVKEMLKNKSVTVKEFPLPHGRDLNLWIQQRVRELGGNMEPKAVELLAVRVGRDNAVEARFGGKVVDVQEVYSLWQVDNEIKKLLALANKDPITAEHVSQLVSENREVDALSIVNAIADGDKQLALSLVQEFLKADPGADEKAGVIQLNALLSEQFRNIFVTQGFSRQNIPEAGILEKTGWKSGRLFIMKKISYRFPEKKIAETMTKLEHLDEELKTSSTPPRVLLDLIITQMF